MTGRETWDLISRFLPISDDVYRDAYAVVFVALKEYDKKRGDE